MKADRVFKNAKLYSISLDGKETRAESVAIKDGKFVFVGSNAEAEEYIGEDTNVTDCQGKTILPGFCDSHMHFGLSVRRFGVADLSSMVTDISSQTADDIVKVMQKIVKDFADSHPDDAVIHGSGWERGWFEGALSNSFHTLTRHDIDAAVSDRPVALDSACGHLCLLNTKALELAGVDKDYPNPQGGRIHREEDGTPSGMIQETSAIREVCGKIPGFEYSKEQLRNALLESQKYFTSQGFTYLCDCMQGENQYETIKEMAEKGELKVRVDGVFNCKDATRDEDMKKAISSRGYWDVSDIFKVNTVKYFIDEDFAMYEPFDAEYIKANNLPEDFGLHNLLWDVEHYKESMKKAKEAGYNIHVHSFGDMATHQTILSMLEARKVNPDTKLRDIIAHIFFIKDQDIKLMAENDIVGSIQPQWESANETDVAPMRAMVGSERFKNIYPNGSLARGGVRLANGSDFTVTMTNALEAITVAMTRKYPKNNVYYNDFKDVPAINPDEITTLKDSIMGWTINGAYQFGREDITGSIEVGKSAEMVVINGDVENTPVEDICLLTVNETLFKGQTVYKA